MFAIFSYEIFAEHLVINTVFMVKLTIKPFQIWQDKFKITNYSRAKGKKKIKARATCIVAGRSQCANVIKLAVDDLQYIYDTTTHYLSPHLYLTSMCLVWSKQRSKRREGLKDVCVNLTPGLLGRNG